MLKEESRVKNSVKNSAYGLLSYVLIYVFSFISRAVLVRVLGNEYVGINGLFSNIISMISLTELGVGIAIAFSLYKPLAEGNKEQIKAIILLYRKCYRAIAAVVAVVGVVLFFFLEFFIKDFQQSGVSLSLLRIVFSIFVVDAVSSYLLSYKKSLLMADQKKYLVANVHTVAKCLTAILQIVVLVVWKNFIFFSVFMLVSNMSENIVCLYLANKKYPFIKEPQREKVDPTQKKSIVKNIKALILHKIGGFAVYSTGNILVSRFFGLVVSGKYSSYLMITTAINTSLEQIFSATAAGYGNLLALGNKKRAFEVFSVNFFLSFWMNSFCAIGLLILFQPFITVWVGEKSLLPAHTVFLMALYFYINGLRYPVQVVKDAAGLFDNDKYAPLLEAVMNIGVSLLLISVTGNISAVVLGTLITSICIPFWNKPYIVFKHIFPGGLKKYFLQYFIYFAVAVGSGSLTYLLANAVSFSNVFLTMGYRLLLCLFIPNVIVILLFSRTAPFRDLLEILGRNRYLKPVCNLLLRMNTRGGVKDETADR